MRSKKKRRTRVIWRICKCGSIIRIKSSDCNKSERGSTVAWKCPVCRMWRLEPYKKLTYSFLVQVPKLSNSKVLA